MAGIFKKRIWQPCICQPNELKREIKKKKNWGGQAKIWGGMAHPGPPLESPLPPWLDPSIPLCIDVGPEITETGSICGALMLTGSENVQ